MLQIEINYEQLFHFVYVRIKACAGEFARSSRNGSTLSRPRKYSWSPNQSQSLKEKEKKYLKGQSHKIFLYSVFFTYQLFLVPLERSKGHFDFICFFMELLDF